MLSADNTVSREANEENHFGLQSVVVMLYVLAHFAGVKRLPTVDVSRQKLGFQSSD